jgi:antitoxin component YwqK of YwqJK toxin-antitoxin module
MLNLKLIFILIGFYLLIYINPNKSFERNYKLKDTIINQIDSNGLKQGLWIEKGVLTSYTFYKNNKKNGPYILYGKNGLLFYFGDYKEDDPVGVHYVFYTNGNLNFKLFNHRVVNLIISEPDFKAKFKYKSHLITYYINGMINNEGEIFHADSFLTESLEDSIWTYYDLKGKITKKVLYNKGHIIK